MVQALEELEKSDAAAVVSAATKALSPRPEPEVGPENARLSNLTQALISELREQLHLQTHDNSSRARARLFAALTTILSDYFVADNSDSIRKKLGQRGDLPPQQYEIVFRPEVLAFCEAFRLRKKQIRDAMQNPDQVDHLLRDRVETGKAPAVSLYTKRVGTVGSRESYILLVYAIRSGAEQSVTGAYRVFESDVSLPRPISPLRVLEAFVDVYGLNFRIGDTGPAKFVLYDVKPYDVSTIPSKGLQVAVEHKDDRFQAVGLFHPTEDNTLEIVAAFAINTTQYSRDLERHGIQVNENRPNVNSVYGLSL